MTTKTSSSFVEISLYIQHYSSKEIWKINSFPPVFKASFPEIREASRWNYLLQTKYSAQTTNLAQTFFCTGLQILKDVAQVFSYTAIVSVFQYIPKYLCEGVKRKTKKTGKLSVNVFKLKVPVDLTEIY